MERFFTEKEVKVADFAENTFYYVAAEIVQNYANLLGQFASKVFSGDIVISNIKSFFDVLDIIRESLKKVGFESKITDLSKKFVEYLSEKPVLNIDNLSEKNLKKIALMLDQIFAYGNGAVYLPPGRFAGSLYPVEDVESFLAILFPEGISDQKVLQGQVENLIKLARNLILVSGEISDEESTGMMKAVANKIRRLSKNARVLGTDYGYEQLRLEMGWPTKDPNVLEKMAKDLSDETLEKMAKEILSRIKEAFGVVEK